MCVRARKDLSEPGIREESGTGTGVPPSLHQHGSDDTGNWGRCWQEGIATRSCEMDPPTVMFHLLQMEGGERGDGKTERKEREKNL